VGFRQRLAVLGEPSFRRLYFARTISLVGDGIAPVAIAFAVLDLTGSATDLGIVLAAHSLVVAALILVGGVYADRLSPRISMLGADLVRTVVVGVIAGLLISGQAQIWQLGVLYAIEGAATAFFNPASIAIVPQVVSGARLQEANALLSLSWSVGKVIGPALAGILLALGDPGWALAANALTFAISAAFLLGLRAPGLASTGVPSFLAELRHGWAEFSSRTWLWVVVLGAAIGNAVFTPAFLVLGPTVARDSLGGSSGWALIAAGFGVGAVAGGVVALAFRPRRPLLVGQGALLFFGLPMALLAGAAPAFAIALGAFASGAAVSLSDILHETVLALRIPPEALSRVSAYDWFGSLALEPLGLALVGPLALGLGTSTTLWAAAAVILACQLAVLSVGSVRRLEIPDRDAEPERVGPLLRRPIDPGD
jgi:MFS family permease